MHNISSTVDVAALLTAYEADLGLTREQSVALVADTLHVSEAQATAWFSRSGAHSYETRALIVKFGIDREVAMRTLSPIHLLSALWSPQAGALLTLARQGSGLDEAAFVTASGVSAGSLRRWDAGAVAPRPELLRRVLDVAGVWVDDLLNGLDWPPTALPGGEPTAFALWLGRAQRGLNVSQCDLATRLGVSQAALNSYGTGRCFPAESRWTALAQRLTEVGAPISREQLMLLQPPEPADIAETASALSASLIRGRFDQGMSHAAVAHFVGDVTKAQICSWETGASVPAAEQLLRLAKTLELDASELAEHARAALEQRLDVRTAEVLQARYGGRKDRGAWVGARIAALGLRARDVADTIGVHRNHLTWWATGRTDVPSGATAKLARALRTTAPFLRSMPAEPCTPFQQQARDLVAARERAGLSQADLRQLTGMNQSELSSYERGLRTPAGRAAGLLAVFLEAPLAA